MPVDSMLVSVAVVIMFAVFAGVMLWGERQTGGFGTNCPQVIENTAASDRAQPQAPRLQPVASAAFG
jgi:hypothetical protein